MYFDFISSPLGSLKVQASEKAVLSISFMGEDTSHSKSNRITVEACFQLKQYFEGHLTEFDLPLSPSGTPFQDQVWRELSNIPFGTTTTYGKIANSLGDPNKVRAVGNANGQNPIAIVIPCHRVIGSTGQLVGYAGGLHRKKWLLDFEALNLSNQISLF